VSVRDRADVRRSVVDESRLTAEPRMVVEARAELRRLKDQLRELDRRAVPIRSRAQLLVIRLAKWGEQIWPESVVAVPVPVQPSTGGGRRVQRPKVFRPRECDTCGEPYQPASSRGTTCKRCLE
jgi:hypothetical protein